MTFSDLGALYALMQNLKLIYGNFLYINARNLYECPHIFTEQV